MDGNRRIRSAIVVALVLASCALVSGLLPAKAISSAGITGIARDASGRALSEVEVLVLREGSAEAVSSVVTDAKGWFNLPAVGPGLYRIVAVKPGYLATLIRVNTFLRSSLDLVLRPLPSDPRSQPSEVPQDRAWALRIPKRSLLREEEAQALLAEHGPVAPASATRREAFLPPVDGGFQQLVSVVAPGSGASASRQAIQGTDTRMRLATSLGERGMIEFSGHRESLGTPVGPGDGAAQLNRQASSVWLDVKVDTDRDAKLAMKAYYAMRDFRTEGPVDAVGPYGGGESQRTWGYDATWTKQVDAASQVALRVGYVNAQLDVPSAFVPERSGVVLASRVGLENRSVDATGSYESLVASGHQLRVGARMRMLDLGAPSVRAATDDALSGLQGIAGWNLAVDAQDSWSVISGVNIVYGMGAQQVLGIGTTGSSLVVPRAGGSWALRGVTVRGLVSYYQPFGSKLDPSSGEIATAFDPASRLGWEAEVETPLPGGVRLRASHAYAPLQFEPRRLIGPAWMPHHLVFATDGNASDVYTTLSAERQSARAAGFVQWTEGSAEGVLSQLALGELPATILADRVLDYRIGRFGARVVPSGTEIALEYQRINEATRAPQSEPAADTVQEYVEVQLSQHLVRFRRPGTSCRLLMAARSPLNADDEGRVRAGEAERPRMLTALNRRISAGLALAF